MPFIFTILIILFVLLAIILNFGFAIIRILFNGFNPLNNNSKRTKQTKSQTTYNRQTTEEEKHKTKKIFKESDGEYVDFEEVK